MNHDSGYIVYVTYVGLKTMRNRIMVYFFSAYFGSFIWSGLSDTCPFDDGLCSWAQVQFDDFDWRRLSGETPSEDTGPENGHITGNDINGYYVYIEATNRRQGDNAILRYTGLYRPERACLSFWYNMYGSEMGTLNVNMRRKNDTSFPVWSKTGNQGKKWIFAAVDLEVGPEVSIEFEAIRGRGSKSDIALDDVSLIFRSCFDCTFDGGGCLWILDENWNLSLDEAKGGKYVHSAVSGRCGLSSVRSFVAPVLAMLGSFCFSFLYFLNGSDKTSLQLYVHSSSKVSLIWTVSGNTTSSWSLVSIFLQESSHGFTLEFKMYTDCMGQAGLDNISVEIGQCHDSSTEVILTRGQSKGSTVKTELAAAGVQVGSVVGAVVFVVVIALVAVCLCSKRRLRDKKDKHIKLHPYSAYSTRIEGNRGDHSHEEPTINPNYTPSADISHPDNNMEGNVHVTSDNTEYASMCKATKYAYGIDDMYDDTCEEKRLRFESTYDHVTANSYVEYDKTYSTTKSESNVCGTYDDVTISSDDAYNKTYVITGAKSSPDKTYAHVTRVTSETSITTSDISTNRDDTYEHLRI